MCSFALAPRKATKFETQFVAAMDDISTKLAGFESLMNQMLDKMTSLEAWRSTSEEASDRLLTQAE